MMTVDDILIGMRKSFSFLWEEYGFKFVGLMPKGGYPEYGYVAELENEWCKLAFQSESGYLEDICIVPKGVSSAGEFVSRWALLSTGVERKRLRVPYTAEDVLNNFDEFARPYLLEMLELAKTRVLFEKRLKELEEAARSNPITIEMVRAERVRLHALGLDSSLGAAMANLRKRAKHE